jgi:hypothetical protein
MYLRNTLCKVLRAESTSESRCVNLVTYTGKADKWGEGTRIIPLPTFNLFKNLRETTVIYVLSLSTGIYYVFHCKKRSI